MNQKSFKPCKNLKIICVTVQKINPTHFPDTFNGIFSDFLLNLNFAFFINIGFIVKIKIKFRFFKNSIFEYFELLLKKILKRS